MKQFIKRKNLLYMFLGKQVAVLVVVVVGEGGKKEANRCQASGFGIRHYS